MKNQHTFDLIDGDFSAAESRELLLRVFFDKIKFHQMKNSSSKECFGKEDKTSLRRIPQLRNSIDEILKLIESAESRDERLEIKSEVLISFVKSAENV